ncbi:hypothetical protein [Microbacterium hydrocarbonoxydans]|uniref:hypothetical protein n=1 Tax=Microbacterium hydrocarbonoxydans TaxID=273678 RepID=UPI003D95B865
MNRKTVYLHLREVGASFKVVKLARTRAAATRDGDVVMPLEIELPWDFFDRAAIRVRIEPMKGQER